MSSPTQTRDRPSDDAQAVPPTGPSDYGTLNATYVALLATVAVATSRPTDGRSAIHGAELPLLGLATFALAKTVAKEKIGTWVRNPFVEESNEHKPGSPRGHGLRHAVGELLTCPRCVGAWAALGVVGTRAASPRAGRVAAAVLAAAGINDFLQAGFRYATERANAAAG